MSRWPCAAVRPRGRFLRPDDRARAALDPPDAGATASRARRRPGTPSSATWCTARPHATGPDDGRHDDRRRRRSGAGDVVLVPVRGGGRAVTGGPHAHAARSRMPTGSGSASCRAPATRSPRSASTGHSPSARSTWSCTSATTSTRTRATRARETTTRPTPPITLDDYRRRIAQMRADPDAQALHLRHPVSTIWDDHDLSDNAWRTGAKPHDPEDDGDWDDRVRAAAQARREWLPGPAGRPATIRWSRGGRCAIGDLAELVLLDTRFAGRDRQAGRRRAPRRSTTPTARCSASAQRTWLEERLREPRPAVGHRLQRRRGQRARAALATPAGAR